MGTYSISCYWKNREEGVGACADRAGRYIRRLEACDPVFAKVFVSSRTREAPRQISADSEVLKPFFEDKTADGWGYRISFVSEHKDKDEQWAFHVRCGASPKITAASGGWPNFCMWLLPTKGSSLKTLLQPATAYCLLYGMVEAWDPDWAVVYDDAVLDDIYQRAGIAGYAHKNIFLGWMTYFARHIGTVPEDLAVHSRINLRLGTLLVLTEEPMSGECPDHVANTKRAVHSLRRTGVIPA